MEDGPTYGFDTLQIHAGSRPDPVTGARQTPIYQSTAYVFRDAEHAAALFNLQEVGYIYSRLTNPTVSVLQERIATLEGGVGAVCCSSGHAAQIMALFPLMSPGCNVIASTRLYGGTVTQANEDEKKDLRLFFENKERSENEFKKILMLIKKYNIINDCYSKAKHFINLASNSLSIFKETREKKILQSLTSFSLERTF